jgi:hypothetical protein
MRRGQWECPRTSWCGTGGLGPVTESSYRKAIVRFGLRFGVSVQHRRVQFFRFGRSATNRLELQRTSDATTLQ